jgi:hypothetical protein
MTGARTVASHARGRWFETTRAHRRSCKWAGFGLPRQSRRDSEGGTRPGVQFRVRDSASWLLVLHRAGPEAEVLHRQGGVPPDSRFDGLRSPASRPKNDRQVRMLAVIAFRSLSLSARPRSRPSPTRHSHRRSWCHARCVLSIVRASRGGGDPDAPSVRNASTSAWISRPRRSIHGPPLGCSCRL